MPRYRLCVDKDLCQGNSMCVAEAPQLFDVTDQGQIYDTVELRREVVGDDDLDAARAAAASCPNGVIRLLAVED